MKFDDEAPEFRRPVGATQVMALIRLFLSVSYCLTDAFLDDLPAQETEVHWGVRIPMRDGVELNATVYRPVDMPSPLPVIFTLTPYVSDNFHDRAWYFSRNGYVFALVDSRGRGNSSGEFIPMVHEARDGHDVVEWFAQQAWCNGRVGMWGASYMGYNQWATAKEFPPHLTTIVPAAAAWLGVDYPMWRNIPFCNQIEWATSISGVTSNSRLSGESDYWFRIYRRLYLEHHPFTDLPMLAHNTTTQVSTWIVHPCRDEYWDAMNPTADDLAHLDLPILSITGHYDEAQPGALEHYRRHMRFGSDQCRKRHYLIIGPWDHGSVSRPKTEIGGLVFGDASLLDLNKLYREWYDWTMKNGPQPEFLRDCVGRYVMGAEEWKYADRLKSITSENLRLYLSSNEGRATDVFHSGSLTTEQPKPGAMPDSYTYDPLDTRFGELEQAKDEKYLISRHQALNVRNSCLVYHGEPFEQDVEVSGRPKLELWLAIDVPDTDFEALLYEILPDGSSILLTMDRMRARYRESNRRPKLIEAGRIHRYDFDGFFFFSRLISRGSRLRLVFTSPNSVFLQKNYNSGGVVAEETAADARTARVTLYHDPDHPSSLLLPVEP